MENVKVTVQVKLWSEIYKKFDKDFKKTEIITCLNEIASLFKDKKKDYVYVASFPTGEKLVENGKISIDKFTVEKNDLFLTHQNLKDDINYTSDPLGIILRGYVEIVTTNILIKQGIDKEYYTLLNRIEKNNLFGLFGTLDQLSGIKPDNLDSKWHAIAGENTFEVCYPWENETEVLFKEYNHIFNNKTYDKNAKHTFLKELNCDKQQENVEVIYFPKHFLIDICDEDKIKITNLLFKRGWEQASYLRELQLELKTITDIIYKLASKARGIPIENQGPFNHKYDFLAILTHYIVNVIKGKSYALVPILEIDYITHIKSTNQLYFSKNKHFVPLIFRYQIIKDNKWGCLLINRLPLLLNYEIKNYILLCEDINKILRTINSEYSIMGYGVKNKSKSSEFKTHEEFKKEFLAAGFGIQVNNINVTSEPFANIILIERKVKINNVS